MEQVMVSRSTEFDDVSRVDMTIAFVLSLIGADETIALMKRRDICSGVRSLCRALALPPDSTPADPRLIAERLSGLTPVAARMSKGRLQNCRSHMETALTYADAQFQRRRTRTPLAPAFADLASKAPSPWEAKRLRRLFHFATQRNADPSGIDTALFDEFLASLARSTVSDYRAVDRETRKTWNRLVASLGDPKLQRVAVPSYVDHYARSVELPKSLWNDLEGYLASRQEKVDCGVDDLLTEEELFGDGDDKARRSKPIRASTANLIRNHVRQFASALVLEGIMPAEEIVALDRLVAPKTVSDGLKFFIGRAGERKNSQTRGIASDLLMIATLWVRLPEVDLKKIRIIVEKVRPKHEGLPESARRSLAPFRDLNNVRAFLSLPDLIVRDAENEKVIDRATANRVATALWIKIAQRAPLRIDQLLKTDLGKNVLRAHGGKDAAVALFYTAAETKNDKALEVPLPKSTVKLLDLYLAKYRPILVDGPTTALFPGVNGQPKRPGVMSRDIQRLMREYVGFAINPHSFRHVAAKLYLSVHPGRYENVQLILGHKKRETTIAYYCELDAEEAFRHFDTVLLGLGEGDERRGGRK